MTVGIEYGPVPKSRALSLRLPGFGWLRGEFSGQRTAIDVGHTRLIVAGAMFALAFSAIAVRLVDVTLLSANETKVAARTRALPTERGEITDRNGILLASSLNTTAVYADPRKILDPAEAARKIVRVLPDMDEAALKARLSSERSFVYIRRNLTPRQQSQINRLGIPGVEFQREDKRIYPHGPIVSHVMGFSDIDNHGIAGIEKFFDERLRSGEAIQLSVDVRLQHIMRQELMEAMTKFKAVGAAGMILDARSGEVLSMVSLPDFDPNNPAAPGPEDARFNRNTLGVYEMGSTFKIFNTAMALEAGTTSMTGGYDASKNIQISRFTISDYHGKYRWLSVPEIFMYSSNIGSVKMAMDVGVSGQRAFMDKLHFLAAPKIELPEVGHPQVPMPWRPINTMTIAFGHGISVSPLQLIAATGAIVNGGIMIRPTLVKRDEFAPVPGERVVSAKTSESMRRLMRLVVEQGTGKEAAATGYVVGGKTGTAEKVGKGGGYKRKALLSSFIGAFPMNDPRYVVLIMMDEPQGTKETYGYATGGWVAAPSAKRIIARMGPMLGLPPIDETAVDVRRLLAVDLGGGPRVATR